jgi:phthiocerol/phenolphthiocerol synthesis type-I polyketide synthase E
LYETSPTFRRVMDRCDEILRPHLQRPLISVLYPEEDGFSLLENTAYTQPALFAIEYALAELWRSWGVRPTFVMGHSVGEFVAACVAGVFGLEDGLRLIAERGRLMQSLRGANVLNRLLLRRTRFPSPQLMVPRSL